MKYNSLGPSGLLISQLSLGSWVTFGKQVQLEEVTLLMETARDQGVNFFDNAEVYAKGQAEELMGAALKKLNWPRLSYLVSTKLYWGINDYPNAKNTLNRKYLIESTHACLKRLGLSHVDLIYCHRPDPSTPIEETAHAMHDLIQRGDALYWGTSEWPAESIQYAIEIAEKHHWHKPIVEQPQYNLLARARVEEEYQPLIEKHRLGLTTWSPLASGVLTGKYLNHIPTGSRATLPSMDWVLEAQKENKEQIIKLIDIAKDLGCSVTQLAIAWCCANKNISSVILGASKVDQLKENLGALHVLPKIDKNIQNQINVLFELK